MLKVLKRKMQNLIGSQIDPFRDEAFRQTEQLRFSVGQVLARMQDVSAIRSLREAEFKVFSQWGEDGIIRFLTQVVPIQQQCFIEVGVENYSEANTRFLLMHDNWKGLIIDASNAHADFLRSTGILWRYEVEPLTAFVRRENINELIGSAGVSGDIGLLSIDIDGMDYWVLEAVTAVVPRVLVVEYNSRFGSRRAVTVPYRADFERRKAHYSCCYYGASLAALCRLADRKGYAFVGANSAGNNAFFVRRDLCPPSLRPLSAEEGFVPARLRESRDPDGRMAYFSLSEELELMRDLPLVDVTSGETVKVGELAESDADRGGRQ